MDGTQRALVETLLRKQLPGLLADVRSSTEPPRRKPYIERITDSPLPGSIMNAFSNVGKQIVDETVDWVTLPGDVLSGKYSLPAPGTPGITEDDGYNVYQDGKLIGNRLAYQEGLIKRATGFAGNTLGSSILTAGATGKLARDPNVIRIGGGGTGKRPRRVINHGGRDFVTASDGTIEFGRIGKEVTSASDGSLPEGFIRLERGEAGKDGYGALHISDERHEAARKLGYEDGLEMIEDVARNYDAVLQQANGRLMLVKHGGQNRYGIVELVPGDDAYYGVTTGFMDTARNAKREHRTSVYRALNKNGAKLLWERK